MLKEMSPIQSSEDGILTKLFRKILIETGFINSINYFINRYVGTKNRTTISRLILAGEMTWNSFTFLLLRVLKAHYIILILKVTKNNKIYVISTKKKQEDYKEKTSGEILKQNFDDLLIDLKLNSKKDQRKLITNYHKKGGKKNKATIAKVLESEVISWKSYIFLVFELLDNDNVTIGVEIKSIHGKVSEHELLISKND